MASWNVVTVRRSTPIPETCPKDLLKECRTSISKKPYSFDRHLPCEDHEYLGTTAEGCRECRKITVTYTYQDLFAYALKCAGDASEFLQDSWLVDGEDNRIIAAFRVTRERIR